MRNDQHGSALLIAVISVLVITVISVGIIRFASRESVGASAAAHEQALVACAEAARIQLLAQFNILGFNAANLNALNVTLSGATQAQGGHYDTPVGNIVIDQVTYLPGGSLGPSRPVRDLSGISSPYGIGGKPMKVVVHCQDGTLDGGRRLEVEFGIRYGL